MRLLACFLPSFALLVACSDLPAEAQGPARYDPRKGEFHLTYTYRRTHIKHVTFDEAWLRAAAMRAP